MMQPGLTAICSVCFCCAASICLCPLSLALAGVAVHSICWPPPAASSRAGVLGRRGFAVESIGARICREGGARVSTNVHVRDLDILAEVHDARRIEIIAEGLPLFGGAQLAVYTTLVSAHHCDGSARARAARVDGIALEAAHQRKERTYRELVGPRSRAKLVVLAREVGGRWSAETSTFLRLLAAARARSETPVLQKRSEQAWRLR